MADATMCERRQEIPGACQLLQAICKELCQSGPTNELTDKEGQEMEVGRGTADSI